MLANDSKPDHTLMRRLWCATGFPYFYMSIGGLDSTGGDVLLAINNFAPHLIDRLRRGVA
jgi:hypothetical protein